LGESHRCYCWSSSPLTAYNEAQICLVELDGCFWDIIVRLVLGDFVVSRASGVIDRSNFVSFRRVKRPRAGK
jgi:hypothetical protein